MSPLTVGIIGCGKQAPKHLRGFRADRDVEIVLGDIDEARARALAERSGVEMPIVQEVHRILHEDGRPQEGLDRLLGRPLTSEEGSVKTSGA